MARYGMPMATPSRDYEAEDAFHTLRRAEEIKGKPELHQRAIAHGKRVVQETRKVIARGQHIKAHDEESLSKGYRKI